jgi:hypothetical protein
MKKREEKHGPVPQYRRVVRCIYRPKLELNVEEGRETWSCTLYRSVVRCIYRQKLSTKCRRGKISMGLYLSTVQKSSKMHLQAKTRN